MLYILKALTFVNAPLASLLSWNHCCPSKFGSCCAPSLLLGNDRTCIHVYQGKMTWQPIHLHSLWKERSCDSRLLSCHFIVGGDGRTLDELLSAWNSDLFNQAHIYVTFQHTSAMLVLFLIPRPGYKATVSPFVIPLALLLTPFSLKFDVSWLSQWSYKDKIWPETRCNNLWAMYSYYGSASVPKWPQK